MPALRQTYRTNASGGLASDQKQWWTGSACDGTLTTRFAGHTLGAGTAGTIETYSVPADIRSASWTISAYPSYPGGTLSTLFEYSQNGAFTDTQVLFNGVVTYTTSATSLTCLHWTQPTTSPCSHGVELAQPGTFIYYLTPTLIDAVLIEAAAPWAAVFFTPLYFATFDASNLCTSLPPPPPDVSLATFNWAPDKLLELFSSLAWWFFCKCTAGTPAPVEPPVPPLTQPPGMPTQPTFPCDPAVLCDSIVRIEKALASLALVVGQDYAADTLQQRWSLPFATIPGTTHTGLRDIGELNILRAVGLLVTVTTLPGQATWPGNPIYLKDLGWLAVDDGGAMLQELRVTRQQQTWFPRQMQLATRVSWSLTPGTEIAVQELDAEP